MLSRMKSDPALFGGRRWGSHQLPDCFEYDAEMLVVLAEFPFYLFEFRGQPLVGRKNLPETHEGPHNGDIDLDGPVAMQDTGEHGDPLFGEGVGQIAAPASARWL